MEVNIEKIMSEIRDEIKEKGLTSDMLSFDDVLNMGFHGASDYDERSISSALYSVNGSHTIPVEPPITGNPIAVFVKKLIRKLTRFYVRPARERQNDYNAHVARALNVIGRYIESIEERPSTAVLEDKIKVLELQLVTAAKERKELLERIEQLESARSDKK